MTELFLAAATLDKTAKQFEKSLERGATKFGQVEVTEMKRRTPVQFGPLRDSGLFNLRWEGNTLILEWTFGGVTANYAVYVHEDLEAFHKVGQAKYVESVTNESAQYAPGRIVETAMEKL
jgi:hypothetical protein